MGALVARLPGPPLSDGKKNGIVEKGLVAGSDPFAPFIVPASFSEFSIRSLTPIAPSAPCAGLNPSLLPVKRLRLSLEEVKH